MPITSGLSGQGLAYHVDIVLCIDATGSMAPIINKVKESALSFYQKFVDEMEKKLKSVQQLRMKVIVFRDYGVDSEPMTESKFFVLDEEKEEFKNYVNSIEAIGGGDEAESSLEAIALAMKSDWVKTGSVRRHVIILYSDAPALPLGTHKDKPGYPSDMPANLAELHERWEEQDREKRAKRMLIFAPGVEPWTNMLWDQVFHTPSKAGGGCDDTDIETCISMLVNSI